MADTYPLPSNYTVTLRCQTNDKALVLILTFLLLLL